MKKAKIIITECPVTGELGLRPEGLNVTYTTVLASMDGSLLAHDLTEHVNGIRNVGQSVWDEIQAFGAMIFSERAWTVGGIMRSPDDALFDELMEMVIDYCDPRMIRSALKNLRTHSVYEVDVITDHFDHRVENWDMDTHYVKEHFNEVRMEKWPEFETKEVLKLMNTYIKHHLRKGFRKARNKYKSSWIARSHYENASAGGTQILKWMKFEGQEFILRFDERRFDVREAREDEYD